MDAAVNKPADVEDACEPGMVSCFKDCCMRITQFCNKREQRCQSCDTRKEFCNNQTRLPPECDLYCYKLQEGGVLTSADPYKILTFVFGGLLAAMLLYIIVRRVWRKSRECCTSNEDHGSPASESLISLESESKAKEQENAGDEDEEVSLQGTPAPESGSESALQRRQPPPPVNMETLANLRAEPWSDQSGAPENVAPPSLTSARPQPANEDDNNATNSSQASQVEMPPTPRAELSGQMENPASGEVGNTACHSCHDSRLCNVPATPDPASTAKYPTGYPFTLNT